MPTPDSILVFINQQRHMLLPGATLVDAVSALKAQPPFAAAINLQFVPNTQYANTALKNNDRIDIISPVTGG